MNLINIMHFLESNRKDYVKFVDRDNNETLELQAQSWLFVLREDVLNANGIWLSMSTGANMPCHDVIKIA